MLKSNFDQFHKQFSENLPRSLERTISLLDEIGNPQNKIKNIIHIAGTNGKGSVAHMLCSVLQQSGYKVGLFTSPHILDFRERIRIDGIKISKVFVEDFINKYKRYFEKIHM